MNNKNHRMISAAIKILLDRSEYELESAKASNTEFTSNTYIIHMVCSIVSSIMVDALLSVRKEMEEDGKV